MLDTNVDVSVLAADGELFVTIRVPFLTHKEAIVAILIGMADVFANIDSPGQLLEELCWEQKTLSPSSLCWVVRRPFSDPSYPGRFRAALSAARAGPSSRVLH